ncbi:MAG: hypothetical protein KDE26_09290 [Bacteroidetes bacterium]|nr:hypothetical protein [Bacteroidota bacterium]
MRESLQTFIRQVFDIREGEGQRAFLMQLNIFLIISTLLVVKPTVNGLFLSEIGVQKLPVTFVLVAIVAVIFSTIYTRLLGKTPLNRIILTTLFVSVLLFILFGILLKFNAVGGWVLYAFYIWVAVFGVLTASQFWIIANVVFNAREAKRLFGFIGSGAIAGGIFGGYLTTILAEALGSENLIFIGAGMLALCIPITTFIWEKNVVKVQTKFQRRKKIANTDHPFKLIRKSAHLSFLASIIGISVIVAKLVDYQFSAIAADKIQDPDELTAFFGFWFSNFNVISLLVQLILTRRIVGTFGIGSSLLFLPFTILLGAVFVFFAPELWAAIFIKMGDGSLKQSVNKASVELLALPVPGEIKNQTKTFIDVVVDSIATGISGIILIFVVNGLDLKAYFISLIIIPLIGLWLFFVMKVRQTYLHAFRHNLAKRNPEEDLDLDLSNTSVLGSLKKVLESGSESQILYVLKKLKLQPDDRLSDSVIQLLTHSSVSVQIEAIRVLYFFKQLNLSELILPFTRHSNQGVKIAAFDYLIVHERSQSSQLVNDFLNHEDYHISLAALVSLAAESRTNPILKGSYDLENRIWQVLYQLKEIDSPSRKDFYKIGALKAMGLARISDFFPAIEQFLEDPNPDVVKQAILSAGDSLDNYFIPGLIQYMAFPDFASEARRSLIKYGKEIIAPLSDYIQDDKSQPEIIQQITLIAQNFGTQPSVDLLLSLLKHTSAKVRLSALRALNQLKVQYQYLYFRDKEVMKYILDEARLYQDTLTILYVQNHVNSKKRSSPKINEVQALRQNLINLLESRLNTNLERIFRLLGLKYPPEDILPIYENIQSEHMDLRANALEYLDNLLDSGLKKVLIPIVETTLLEALSESAIKDLDLKIPDEDQCFQLLLVSDDNEVKETVTHLKKAISANT